MTMTISPLGCWANFKKVFFTKDNLEENPIQLCVITEIFLIEYENISQSSIKNFIIQLLILY